MMTRFRNFKVQYNKKYDSADEDTIRFLIFSENYQIIEKLNEHNHSFRVAVNKFADLTSAEFKSLYLGYKKSAQSNARVEYLNTTDLPDQVDWRQLVNPVKNQGQCGSCWAFSAVAGLEAVYALNTKEVLSFSEQVPIPN
jgi:cathepsin L